MRGVFVVAGAVVAAALLAGCLSPFRVHVDGAVLATAPGWTVTPGGAEGSLLGPKSKETRYAFVRDPDAAAPFSGSLQVFSIRSVGRIDSSELLELARDLVEQGAAHNAIQLQAGGPEGRRTVVSGVETDWFVREGQATQSGDLFEQGVHVRILGEVGHDGRSDTSFLAIGMAQTSRTNRCPILVSCQPEETNLQTWIQIVGDPEGTIQGASSGSGFVDHLVTR